MRFTSPAGGAAAAGQAPTAAEHETRLALESVEPASIASMVIVSALAVLSSAGTGDSAARPSGKVRRDRCERLAGQPKASERSPALYCIEHKVMSVSAYALGSMVQRLVL
jgi:hypothetical protein